jgi:RNA recognition motif-containing protein
VFFEIIKTLSKDEHQARIEEQASRTVFVNKLGSNTTKEQLEKLFSDFCGPIERIMMDFNHKTQRFKGNAKIRFKLFNSVSTAL